MLRKLLKAVPTTSVLLALRSKGEPVRGELWTPAGFAIAVQCWSFKQHSLFDAIELTAAAGAGGVEIFPGQEIGGPLGTIKVDPAQADLQVPAILKHCRKHGVQPVNFGVVDISGDEAGARVVFDFAKRLGVYGVTTESLDAIDTLERLAIEYDLKVCFHNHPKPTKLWHPDSIWDAVRDRDPRLGFCADVGHWASSGLDPVEIIRKVAPRVRSFHFKDRASLEHWTHDRPFGTGKVDLPAILDEVTRHGFAGNVTIEYEHNRDTNLAEIAQCVGYLRAYATIRT